MLFIVYLFFGLSELDEILFYLKLVTQGIVTAVSIGNRSSKFCGI